MKGSLHMKNTPTFDYQSYYKEIFATEKEREQERKTKFFNLFSDMILKYSETLEERKQSNKGGVHNA
jgi:hypothetical protein